MISDGEKEMTAAQFIRRRKKFFRTQAQAAEAIGVTFQSVQLWEAGKRPVPKYAEKILDLYEALEALRSPASSNVQ